MGEILNPKEYYWLEHHEPNGYRIEPAPRMYHTRNFDDQYDYYYVAFKDGQALNDVRLDTFIPADILAQIKDPNSNTLLILNNSHEAFVSVVDPLYKYIVFEQKVPVHKVVLMTGAFNILEEVDRVAGIYKMPQIKTELELPFEEDAVQFYQNEIHEKDDLDNPDWNTWAPPNTLHDGPYKKKFLNFNRRWRLHRPTMFMLLKKYGLVDHGHISLAPSDDNQSWPKMLPYIKEMHYEFPKILSILDETEQELLNQEPLYLDTQDLVTNRAKITQDHNWLYEETYFSLISETHYYTSHLGFESTQFLSEKVWKSILYKHPFIVISSPGILRCLKHIGYKTFEDIIDESYDKIQNDGDRMLAIAEETKRLCNLSQPELKKFIERAREICEYNFNVIVNKENFFHKMNY